MAIVIEEQRSGTKIVTVITWLAILLGVGAAIYYVFFKKPQFIELSPPSNFSNTGELAKIELNPEEIINSPGFQSLKQYVTPLRPTNFGRQNPFLSF